MIKKHLHLEPVMHFRKGFEVAFRRYSGDIVESRSHACCGTSASPVRSTKDQKAFPSFLRKNTGEN